MRLGLTLPNYQWIRYSDAEMIALDDLAPEVIVWLLYGSPIDQVHAQQLAPFLKRHDQTRIVYRPYRDDIPTLDPTTWAVRCDHMVSGVGYPGELIPANEMNLAVEHGSESWDKHCAWLKGFAQAWRSFQPDVALHLPALSPSGSYQAGFAAYHRAGIFDLFDVIDAHMYAPDHVWPGPLYTKGKPICVTEFNQMDPGQFARERDTSARDAVWFLMGGTEDQKQYDLLRQPAYYASFKAHPKEVPLADFDSPNHDGPRTQTLGVVLHATLGGSATVDGEYQSTIGWFNNPASQVSAHAVVGPGGKVHRSVRTDEIAWHAKAANADHLGVEMAKAHLGDAILPEILDATAKLVAGWCHDYQIPLVWSAAHGIEEHRFIPGNNHQDVGGPFDRDDFMRRVKHYAGQGDELTDAQKKAVLDDLDLVWGMSKADTIKANPAESERAIHERIVAIKILLGVN